MVILLSGEIASGKTTSTQILINKFGFRKISTSQYLIKIAESRNLRSDRLGLQEMGDALDGETHGEWVARLAEQQMKGREELSWILDSIRRDFQIDHFRRMFGKKIRHIHLFAPDDFLERRFVDRRNDDCVASIAKYFDAKKNETEIHASSLGVRADLCINTSRFIPDDVAEIMNFSATGARGVL